MGAPGGGGLTGSQSHWQSGHRRRPWKGWLVLALGLILLSLTPVPDRLERAWLDGQFTLLRAAWPRPVGTDIVVVGIDDATLAAFPEPLALWHNHLALVLAGLAEAGPRAVGLDLVLPERSQDVLLPGGDRALFVALGRLAATAPLVMARTVDARGRVRPVHVPFLAAVGEAGTGLAVFPLDADGRVRRFDEGLGEGGQRVPTLAGTLARRLGRAVAPGLLDYARSGPTSYLPLVTVRDWAARGDRTALAQAFQGRVVLVGSVLPFEDRHPTPLPLATWDSDPRSPGVLIQAQALGGLLGPGLVQPAAAGWSPALVLAGSLFWFAFRRPLPGLAALALFWAALAVGSLILLHQGIHLATAAAMGAAGLAGAARLGREAVFQYRERLRLVGAFQGYVSPPVLRMILDGRLAGQLASQRRSVAVLFADFRDFTPYSERTPPEAVVALLNRYYEAVTRVIHLHGGTIDNFRGDGIMCLFGAPQTLPDPCRSGFAAARAMLEAVAALNIELERENHPPIHIGVSLAYGEAVVGPLGAASRHVYSAIGDVANVSARLEGLTKELGYPLVVGAEVAQALAGETAWDDLGPQQIKGHTPVRAYGWPARNGNTGART